jgi:lipoprotein-anchoring transpeptidase ErfK/SrfK
MRRTIRGWTGAALAAAVLVLGGCVVQDEEPDAGGAAPSGEVSAAPGGAQPQAPAQPAAPPAPTPPPPPDLRLEVNVAAREVHVFRNDQRIASHPVAVGTSKWPTRTGEWTIGQVIWNPRWVPPKEEGWAEDEEEKEPGAADNPLGHAQLVYDAPRSIHGTNEPESLGKAASHGSIRVSNEVAKELARLVMEAGGAGKDEAWYQRVQANRKERVEVPIPNPVPIRVVAGGEGSSGEGESKSGQDS